MGKFHNAKAMNAKSKNNKSNIKKKSKLSKKNRKKLKENSNSGLYDVYKHGPISNRKLTTMSLKDRMLEKLKVARFRMINERLYTSNSTTILKVFKDDKESFNEYHKGFKQQVTAWPVNPVDVIVSKLLSSVGKKQKVADFGCGEAIIADKLGEKGCKVHSFDFVALNDRVTECDMAHTPLENESVDFAVFCLSLMSTELSDYIKEANRVLKNGGVLEIAEVESRFTDVETFIQNIECYGFKFKSKDFSHNYFYFFTFRKILDLTKPGGRKHFPDVTLKPCLYKKRASESVV